MSIYQLVLVQIFQFVIPETFEFGIEIRQFLIRVKQPVLKKSVVNLSHEYR
jgi:ABC-type uncharacterized transport system permease subunit